MLINTLRFIRDRLGAEGQFSGSNQIKPDQTGSSWLGNLNSRYHELHGGYQEQGAGGWLPRTVSIDCRAECLAQLKSAIAHDETGVIVGSGDAAAMGDALARYASDPELRLRHGRAGRARIAGRYSNEQTWAAWLSLYRSMLR